MKCTTRKHTKQAFLEKSESSNNVNSLIQTRVSMNENVE